MNISAYIKYWNNVVRAWLDYDLSDMNFRNEIDNVIRNPKLKGKLRMNHVPGPYMGNPKKASIVILNYNPGGQNDYDPLKNHQSLGCCKYYYSVINYIDRHGYSGFAEDFPYLNDNVSDELKRSLDGGREWWNRKKDWIDNLTGNSTKFPFAMEVCGWHSKSWSSSVLKNLNVNGFDKYVKDAVVEPMIEVIKSNHTIGFCIGGAIGDMLLNMGFVNITDRLANHLNIPSPATVNVINVSPNNNGYTFILNSNVKTGRNYRLLWHKKKDAFVINTWVNGSNHHPSKDYFGLERNIVSLIKSLSKTPIAIP